MTDFEARLWLSSVQLVRADDSNNPTATASGALIDYGAKPLLLTVEHATGDQKCWVIQLRYVPGKGTQLYSVGAMHFLKKGSLATTKKRLQTVDFAYAEVPRDLCAVRQEIDPTAMTVLGEAPITIHGPKLTDVPTAEETYGFCGMIKPEFEPHPGTTVMGGEIRPYSGLKYLRTEDDFHILELPFPHPGDEHFKGCSGAPVLSEDGKLAGLSSGGDIQANEIRVLSLCAYKMPIDILVDSIR